MSNSKPRSTALSFAIDERGGCGRFSRCWAVERKTVDRLIDAAEGGLSDVSTSIRDAKRMLKSHPDCLELSQFLSNRYFEAELFDEALAVREAAFAKAMALIPEGFEGEISYGELDNRPFLRLAHGRVLDLSRADRNDEALKLARWVLARCPDDNLGLRMLIPDLQFAMGQFTDAAKVYLEQEKDGMFPEHSYQLGLLRFNEGNFVSAVTHLRRGIFLNVYIAEILTGRVLAFDHCCWTGSNAHQVEWAEYYMESSGRHWSPAAVKFLDWVFNTAPVLRERAEQMAFYEALLLTRVGDERTAIINSRIGAFEGITDALSKMMVRRARNAWGQDCWPWEKEKFARRFDEAATEGPLLQ